MTASRSAFLHSGETPVESSGATTESVATPQSSNSPSNSSSTAKVSAKEGELLRGVRGCAAVNNFVRAYCRVLESDCAFARGDHLVSSSPSSPASTPLQRALWLDDPFSYVIHKNILGTETASTRTKTATTTDVTGNTEAVGNSGAGDDKLLEQARAAAAILSTSRLGLRRPKHLKTVQAIDFERRTTLVDLQVITLARLPSEEVLGKHVSRSDQWAFFSVADETGSIVLAVPPQVPPALAQLIAQGDRPGGGVAGLLIPGLVFNCLAIKPVCMAGRSMVMFTKQSSVQLLGSCSKQFSSTPLHDV